MSAASSVDGSAISAIEAISRASGAALPTIAVGPVEAILDGGALVKVLGQVFDIAKFQSAFGRQLSQGDYVLIASADSGDGEPLIGHVFASFGTTYVPGASPVYIRASVTKWSATGNLGVGETSVDVASTLPEIEGQLGEGATVAVTGTQPSIGGVILPELIQETR